MSTSGIQKKQTQSISKEMLKTSIKDPQKSKETVKTSSNAKYSSTQPKNFRQRYTYAKKAETEEDENSKIVKCPTCQNTTNEKSLISFTCKHTICGVCLSRYLIKDDFNMIVNEPQIQIDCPICKLNGFQMSLPDIKKLLNDSIVIRNQKLKQECKEHNSVYESYCIECKKWLCAQCKSLFHKQYYKYHTLSQNEPPKAEMCPYHNDKPLNLYCNQCNIPICYMCTRKNEPHFGHSNILYEDFVNKILNSKNGFRYSTFERFENALFNVQENFKKDFMNSFEINKSYIDRIIEYIEKIKKEYIDKKEEYLKFIENYFQIIKSSFNNYYQDLKDKDTNIKTINFVKSVVKEVSTVDFSSDYLDELNKIVETFNSINSKNFFKYELKFYQSSIVLDKSFQATKGQIYSIVQLDNDDICTGGDDNTVSIWDYKDFKLKCKLQEHKGTIFAMAKLDNGCIATGSGDTFIKIWNVNKESDNESKPEEPEKSNKIEVNDLYDNKEGNKGEQENKENIQSNDKDKNQIAKEAEKVKKAINNKKNNVPKINSIATLIDHTKEVYCLSQIDKDKLCSGSKDLSVIIWSLTDYKCIVKLNGHTKSIGSMISPNKNTIISGSSDCKILIWNFTDEDIKNNQSSIKPTCLKGHTNGVFSLALLKNGQIASGSCDKTVKIWDWDKEKKCVYTFKGHNGYVWSVIQLQSNSRIASASSDMEIKIWDVVEYRCVSSVKAHNLDITCLYLGKNGKLISGSIDKNVKFWDY